MFRLFIVITLSLLFSPLVAHAAPKVVVTLLPLHSLVASVMQGVAVPVLLVNNLDPHHHQLKPSQARRLREADLVVWMGREIEPYLVKVIQRNAASQLEIKRELSSVSAHADSHLWLNPVLVKDIVDMLVQRISLLDPDHAKQYGSNASELKNRLDGLDAELQQALSPLQGVPFVSYHRAVDHLVQRYSLNQVGIVTDDPEKSPGLRSLSRLHAQIKQGDIACMLYVDPEEQAMVLRLSRGSALKSARLNLLGHGLNQEPAQEPAQKPAQKPGAYFALMQQIKTALLGCLATP
ncbi:MAG: zinc ABC transporter substrate-binding protein [Gammaproteobacteria bacterium]|nr:zinc ABC transporter substrate-binding protein [Gammaproteobacteria bacterium]